MYKSIYAAKTPELLSQLANTPEMQRLSEVGMHCGCEYSEVEIYKNERARYSRLGHSIGVAAIVWNFTGDIRQAAAGLLHDIATPVFAHSIDFMNNDYLTQESTEDMTLSIIENSKMISSLLKQQNIRIDEVSDYHRYPIADNDTPMLSADRLEYTLGNAYTLFHMEFDSLDEMYSDLAVATNEYGSDELCFQSIRIAKKFVDVSLRNSYLYVSDQDRFLMQYLADMVRNAIRAGALEQDDLYATESEALKKLRAHKKIQDVWDTYTKISSVIISDYEMKDRYCVNVSAKKRYIDPLVMDGGKVARISHIDENVKKDIESFLQLDFDKWLCLAT